MGTTLTLAKVHGDEVSLAHVGDSRAYRMRESELTQLTRDHSLVAELERSGQITAEAAEHHPQRSIITRALGPEPDVEVDTYTLAGRDGDVFLICSDGLTSMISDDEVTSILRSAPSLDAAADALVRAANQSGGKDNITVILFRLGEGVPGEEADTIAPAPADDETIAGTLHADEVQAAAGATPDADATDATFVHRRAEPLEPVERRPAQAHRPRRRRGRAWLRATLALVLLAAVIGGAYLASRQVYFVGTNDGGLVTVYRGIPYDLPLGIHLYQQEYASAMPARAIPAARRDRVLDHQWRSRGDAVDLVRALERGQLEAGATN
jgi:hypothetical protein